MIDLSCRVCGSNRIAFNHAVSDACDVACEECGTRMGNYGELKQAVAEQLARRPSERALATEPTIRQSDPAVLSARR